MNEPISRNYSKPENISFVIKNTYRCHNIKYYDPGTRHFLQNDCYKLYNTCEYR